jgi:peroxiredoxin
MARRSISTILAATVMLSGLALCAAAGTFNRKLDVGDPAPVWKPLPSVAGQARGFEDYREAKVLVVAFTCNHCPVANSYEERFKAFVKDFEPRQVKFVAISVSHEPADSLEKLRERARQQGYNFDYLQDLSQQTGRDYGATVTPHLFVLDSQRKIAYMGAFDDNWQNAEAVEESYVRNAVDALLAGKRPEVTESRQTGCGIGYVKP